MIPQEIFQEELRFEPSNSGSGVMAARTLPLNEPRENTAQTSTHPQSEGNSGQHQIMSDRDQFGFGDGHGQYSNQLANRRSLDSFQKNQNAAIETDPVASNASSVTGFNTTNSVQLDPIPHSITQIQSQC